MGKSLQIFGYLDSPGHVVLLNAVQPFRHRLGATLVADISVIIFGTSIAIALTFILPCLDLALTTSPGPCPDLALALP